MLVKKIQRIWYSTKDFFELSVHRNHSFKKSIFFHCGYLFLSFYKEESGQKQKKYSLELQSLNSLNTHHLAPALSSRRRGYSWITSEGQSSPERGEGGKHSIVWFYCKCSIFWMIFVIQNKLNWGKNHFDYAHTCF